MVCILEQLKHDFQSLQPRVIMSLFVNIIRTQKRNGSFIIGFRK